MAALAVLSVALALTGCSATPPADNSATVAAGPAEMPVVTEALGLSLRTQQVDELEHGLLRTLTDRYAADRGLSVTVDEVLAFREAQRRFMATRGVEQPVPGTEPADEREMSDKRHEFLVIGSAAEQVAEQALIAADSPSTSTGSSR